MDVPRREEACRGVPTQKDCKQALLAARVATEESLDCGSHLDRVAEFQGPCSSSSEGTQRIGDAVFLLPAVAGGRFRHPTGDFFRAPGAERRQATPRACTTRKQARKRQDKRYKVAVVVFATLLRFCRRPDQSAVDPLAEGDERDVEEL
ncbi:hypothetical protein NDU88_002923 [Pleurodeles waltl]|uniref:Uncharacterized protein n=1 Tax=Pleurodeles waltl TaxID=8319 RepID=A0AAV7WMM1_PLEWA|nr:hypothetical protein NDU88_002923 [Pleurodeles waltl]